MNNSKMNLELKNNKFLSITILIKVASSKIMIFVVLLSFNLLKQCHKSIYFTSLMRCHALVQHSLSLGNLNLSKCALENLPAELHILHEGPVVVLVRNT
jgi:hypothetical protein